MDTERRWLRVAEMRLSCAAAEARMATAGIALVRRYREDQARIPRGVPGGGRWTDEGAPPRDSTAEVIYICVRVGSVPITDASGSRAYALSYLCGYDNQLVSWISATRRSAIIRDPRL